MIAESQSKTKEAVPRSAKNLTPAFGEGFYNEDFEAKIQDYNATITNFHEAYKSFVPFRDVLVRVYLKPTTRSESGILLPNIDYLPIKTNNNVGTLIEVPNPYPYTRKAVIVNVPEGTTHVATGDSVLLGRNMVASELVGKGKEATVRIPACFIHPEVSETTTPPLDPENPNYGYCLIPSFEIIGKL
jgi:hypothetical protein